ncbi:Radical SAM domain protein [Thioalkalivibrio sp. K90mix]|jgi:DNA repair photolyase|uniref:PA0069 family radical SAM protein n=1 Tax=unclassified Thioalkalivibrio TaxID=2621013 RepID=UPI000195A5E8|nr:MULTISPECIES: PA0069 family radical SAM protein [unclassified Thioalkalivibrio]ADC71572.1 Radical SAM domain protein [Thioalkalivibrio sp. K90mix]
MSQGDGPVRGRGATIQPLARFETTHCEPFDDGWVGDDEEPRSLRTEVTPEHPRTVLSWNQSPDVPFELSLNPYRGCEHGCAYCFARPAHAYVGLSPGLDFESRLFAKVGAADCLRRELARPAHRVTPLALGINTDAYQPVEREWRITREVLEVLAEACHPVSIVTKSALVERDLDLLGPMAEQGLVQVAISVTTLDRVLSRHLEPRAAAPQRRLETMRRLSEAGVSVAVLVAPLIPVLTDGELESLLDAAREAGATSAGYVLLRLPREVAPLFEDWLRTHHPLKADHVLQRLREAHGGRLYDSTFGHRMVGTGPYAALLRQRFRLARRRAGLAGRLAELDTTRFHPPAAPKAERDPQLDLF